MTNKNTSICILGGGISGLSVAYALQKKGYSPTVYEQAPDVGGMIKTSHNDGWLVEEGPNTIMAKSQPIWELIQELNLQTDLVEANTEAKRRFVVRNNRPVALPTSMLDFIKSPLLSTGAKLRLLKEPFLNPTEDEDETIASFIERRLGKQPLSYGVNPFVSGVYAGNPRELSIKHTFSSLWEMEQEHGSLLKGMLANRNSGTTVKKALISFSKGLQSLPNALAQALTKPVQTSSHVQAVQYQNNRWKVSGRQKGHSFSQKYDIIISTLPTHTFPSIFEFNEAQKLSELSYSPLSVVALGFQKDQIEHPLNGFGMLIPEVEELNTLGILFSSTLFPNRAPEEHALLTCFVGGARQPDEAKKSKATLIDQLCSELDGLLGLEGKPVFTHHNFWKRAIPQYQMDYDHYLSLMESIENQHPGIFLCGNYRKGVSVPDCILSGMKTAKKVESFLSKK